MKKLLVLSPHADDAEIGCGGYISRVIAEGGKVLVSLMTASTVEFRHSGEVTVDTRMAEFTKSMELLGAEWEILEYGLDGKLYTAPQAKFVTYLDDRMDEFQPTEVLLPLPSSHQDHRYAWEVGIAATRPSPAKWAPRLVAAYEGPQSNWGDGAGANAGNGGIYADISKYWSQKENALKCYGSQMRGEGHLVSTYASDTLARQRGLECGVERAELFHALRILV